MPSMDVPLIKPIAVIVVIVVLAETNTGIA